MSSIEAAKVATIWTTIRSQLIKNLLNFGCIFTDNLIGCGDIAWFTPAGDFSENTASEWQLTKIDQIS